MNEILFFTIIVLLTIVLLLRHKIVEYLDENFYIQIESEKIVYVLTFLFTIVIIMGMLGDNTKEKYGDISKSYENMRPNTNEKPHKWFDINFDIFK